MPYKCIAVDDELPALELIKNYVSQVPDLQMLHSFNDAVSAGEFLRNNPVDILFVDINMPDIILHKKGIAGRAKQQFFFTEMYVTGGLTFSLGGGKKSKSK